MEFNEWLGDSQCFVPHGQCSSVHIGGHAQTGGYGQSGRSFGLLGDHIESLVVVDPDDDVAQVKEVRKDNNPDLFFALLGGSPGNLGVVTHLTLTIRRSDDYVGSYGMRAVHFFTQGKLQRFLKLLADMSDNETWPRNFDLCISVLSGNHKPWFHFPDLDHRLREDYPEPGEDNGYNGTPSHIPFTSIIVYAQWCKFEPYETCPTWWFDQFGSWAYAKERGEKPMHELGKWWIMPYTREFDIPYIKRTYVSNSNTLGTSNWPKWTAERCQKITQEDNNCYLCAQIQFFGGQSSQYASNAGNGTAYSWRDARMFATMDAFYDDQAGKAESAKAWAQEWQDTNDAEIRAHGQNMGQFGDKEQRVLWGCYQTKDETKDLDSVHEKYYDDDTYDRLKKIRKAVDPHGIYTPNKFCVKAGD